MLAAAQHGGEKSFLAFVAPLAPTLQRLAQRISRNSADAEDIRQESLLKVYLKIDQFSGAPDVAKHEFQSWTMKIAANSAIDFIRRKHSSRFVALEECHDVSSESEHAHKSGWGESPERGFLRREQLRRISQAITKLPPDLRRVCLLRNVMELSTQEVAARLGISNTAVRLRLFRAHSRLRKSLGAEVSFGGAGRRSDARPAKSGVCVREERVHEQRAQSTASPLLPFSSAGESCVCGD
jgi:RNA polymerase sigma-70 factor, ECF subfamily